MREWLRKPEHQAFLFSQGLALLLWLVALYVRDLNIIPVWYDQENHLSNGITKHFFDPYVIRDYVYVPWLTVILLPFGLIPLSLSVLIQTSLMFGLLTAVIFKFGGSLKTVFVTLLSFMAFDAALEINVDWLIALALLVPETWSAPLLLIKPQNASGVLLSYKRRDFIRTIAVSIVIALGSFLVWGNWPIRMWKAIQTYTLGRSFNLAPIVLLPLPVSLLIGLALAYIAWRRRDPALSILAWLFFVPYIPFYSLLIPFAMLSLRAPRVALVANIAMWLIYGGTLGFDLLAR